MKILMVCLGNICRSPLAEGIASHLVGKAGLDWEVDSAGTSGWHDGALPDKRSIAIAKEKGLDITNQRSRKLRASDFVEFDLILAMDRANLRDILALAPEEASPKVHLILNYTQPGLDLEVPDPYHGGPDGFEHVFHLLEAACQRMIEDLAEGELTANREP